MAADENGTQLMLRKQRLREQMRARRTLVAGAERLHAAVAAANHLLALIGADFAGVIGAYFPTGDEFDSLPLLHMLKARGMATALPVVAGRGLPLQFFSWRAGDVLEKGAYGIQIPAHRGLSLRPDVLIIPLLAFDRSGTRLGYGGGYYDRTLHDLRAAATILAIGLGYDFQEIADLPAQAHDQRLDWIVTPAGARQASGG